VLQIPILSASGKALAHPNHPRARVRHLSNLSNQMPGLAIQFGRRNLLMSSKTSLGRTTLNPTTFHPFNQRSQSTRTSKPVTMRGPNQLKCAKLRVHNSSPELYDDRSPNNIGCYKSQHCIICSRIKCCLYCAVVLGENIFYETLLFIIEMRILLGFISLDDFI
jgi:hypothetical protein